MTSLNKAVLIHYNSKQPINCNIRNDRVDKFFSAELTDGVRLNINKGDPVVIGLLTAEGIEMIGGSIASAVIQDGSVKSLIILADIIISQENKNVVRYSTSLFGILSKNNMVVSDICIRGISETSLSMFSGFGLDIDELVEIDMFLKEGIEKYRCRVVKKQQKYDRHDYELEILHDDESLASIKQFASSIQSYHAEMMSTL